jgi:hypothetical protein
VAFACLSPVPLGLLTVHFFAALIIPIFMEEASCTALIYLRS